MLKVYGSGLIIAQGPHVGFDVIVSEMKLKAMVASVSLTMHMLHFILCVSSVCHMK